MNVRRKEDTISTPPPPPPPLPPTWSPLGVSARKAGSISGSGGRPPLHPRTPSSKSKKTKITMINPKSPPPPPTSKRSSSKTVPSSSNYTSLTITTTSTGTVKSPPTATRDALMISRKLFHPSYDNDGNSSLDPAADQRASTIKSSTTANKDFFKESSSTSTMVTTTNHQNSSTTKPSFFEGMIGSDSSNDGNVLADEARDDDDDNGSKRPFTTNQNLDLSTMWNAITDLLQPSSSSSSPASHLAPSQLPPPPSSETTFLSMEEIEVLMNQQIPVEMVNRIDFDAFTYRHLNPPSRPKDDYTKMFRTVEGHSIQHHQAPQLQLDSSSTSIAYLSMVVKECFTDLTSGSSSSLSTCILKPSNGNEWIRISRPPCIPHVEHSIHGLQDVANRLHFVVDYFWNIVLMTAAPSNEKPQQQQQQQSKYITATFQRNIIGSYMGTLEWMEQQIQSSSTLAIVAATAAVGKGPTKTTTISSDRVIEVKKLLVDIYVGTTQRIETLIGLLQVFKRTREIIDFIPNIGVLYCYDQHTTEQNLRLNKYMIRWFYRHYNSSNILQYCRELDIVNMAVDYDLCSVAVFEWIGNAIDIVYQPTKGKHLVPTNCLYEHICSKNKAIKKKGQEPSSSESTAIASQTKT